MFCLSFRGFEGDREVTLLTFLQQQLMRYDVTELLAQGAIRLNGQTLSHDGVFSEGDLLEVDLATHHEDPYRDDWQIIWENHQFLVVYKPPLLPVSRTTRNLFGTLISEIRRQTPWRDARLMHRLDTETSGLILLAKHEAADRRWKKNLDRLLKAKVYHARVSGIPDWGQKDMTVPLSERNDSPVRTRMYPVLDHSDPAFKAIKACHTRFRCLQRSASQALIECELLTGRKHQIRAHLAALGHPIVGDKIYAFDSRYYLQRLNGPLTTADYQILGAEHQQLQAVELTLALSSGDVCIRLPAELRLKIL